MWAPHLLLPLVALAVASPTFTREHQIREENQEQQAQELGDLGGVIGLDAVLDYVIVGGGTACLVLANRLSANSSITVAVVEAGFFYQVTNPVLGRTPAGDVIFAGSDPSDTNPLVDWNFVTAPQAGANNRKIHYARGKCLGGSLARNFMIYQRGTAQSCEQWAGRVGDTSSSWENLQPFFRKSVQFTQPSNTREAMHRRSLKVYTGTLAKRIIFNANKRATGVIVESTPNLIPIRYNIRARKEVILSAGAFQSPQWLMVSGVGPRAQLQKFNIPIVAERPGVGQTMEDHIFFGPTLRVKVETLTRIANDLAYTGAQLLGPYTLKKQGPLTNPVCDFLGREKIPRELLPQSAVNVLDSRFPPDWPELEYLTAPGSVGDFSNLLTAQSKDGFQYATILGGLVAPLSRGTVTLKSADTKDLPIIDPTWITDPTD
ncbi:hypothetical protein OQA88_1718 [Cercophora sp. LCS_1]